MKADTQTKPAGFSLIELIITIVVAGIIAVGVIQVAGQLAGRSANPMIRYQAVSIAESYLDEILSREFALDLTSSECDPTGLTRAQYTNICHYQNITNEAPTDQTGNSILGLGTYNVSIAITESALGSGSDAVRAIDSQLITVTVTGPENTTINISAYRTFI